MPYASTTELQRAAGGRDNLIQLTDQEAVGQIDATYLSSKELKVEGVINGYLQHRYAVPIADADLPEVIKLLAAEETIYRLKVDRQSLTDLDQTRHEERVSWLEGVRRGEISLGLDPRPTESTSVVPTTGTRDTVKHSLTRDKFEGYV